MNLDSLRHDHAVLAKILEARRTATAETLPAGTRILWQVYLTILEDALMTLNSLISHLSTQSR